MLAMMASAKRSLWKFAMMQAKPMFSMPIRFSAGTRQSSKNSSAVSEAHQPIFFSLRPTPRPGVPFSTSSRLTPPYPSLPVRTATV
ncbi:hypothetical protein D3C76_1418300 [compost metagenome]